MRAREKEEPTGDAFGVNVCSDHKPTARTPRTQDAHEDSPRGVPEPNPLPVSLGPLDPFPHHVLVAPLADPHALVSKKGVGFSLGVPPVLVDAVQAILGKVPKDIGPGGAEAQSQAPGDTAVVLEECGPPGDDPVAVGTNEIAEFGRGPGSKRLGLFWHVPKVSPLIEGWLGLRLRLRLGLSLRL